MKLQARILAGYFVSSFLILMLGATILVTINSVTPVVDDLERDVTDLGHAISHEEISRKIVSLRLELSRAVHQFIYTKDIGSKRQYDRAFQELLALFKIAIKAADNKDEAVIYENLRDTNLILGVTERKMIHLAVANKFDEARAIVHSVEYDQLNVAITDFISWLANKKHVQSTDIFSQLIDVSRLTQINRKKLTYLGEVTAGLVILILVTNLVVGVVISRSISRPLTRLKEGADAIGQGDLNNRINLKRQDEIGQLSLAFDLMTDRLQMMMKERDRAEEKLNSLNGDLEVRVLERTRKVETQQDELIQLKKMESLGSMTAGISHNLNNLLHPIGMYSAILLKQFPVESDKHEAMDIILKSCDKASDLVKNLMAYSRQEEGLKSVQSISSVIDEALSLIIPTIPTTAKVRKYVDGDTGDVVLNKGQIQSAVMNLISNAVDALGDNTGEVTIALTQKIVPSDSSCEMQAFASITVTDTGSGMNEETKEKMFDPFYTTKRIGKGTGLGLSTVYGTVTDHGGIINCSSSLGKGTTFEILLPLKENPQMTVVVQSYGIAKEG